MGPWLIPLLGAVPDIIHLFTGGANSTGAVVEQLGNIAMKVTGKTSPDDASKAIAADPNLALQYRTAVLSQQVQLAQIAAKREADDAMASNAAERALTDRIASLEGTASDLKSVPVLGTIMLFIRGSQRPAWGFATMYFDYCVFATGQVFSNTALLILAAVNLLVLSFLYGERAVKNVMPLIIEALQVQRGDTHGR